MSKPYIILSFTTFIRRINYLTVVLNAIKNQTLKPDEVRCYTEVEEKEFNEETKKLMIAANVKLYPAKAEDKGYKKLINVLEEFRGRDDVVIIAIDDDWNYKTTLVAELLNYHQKFPQAIIIDRGRRMIKNRPYASWGFFKSDPRRPHETLIMSGSGSLYKPTFFNDSVFDKERLKLSPTADDLWWTVQAIIAGTPVLSMTNRSHAGCGAVAIPNNFKLYEINKRENLNQFANLVNYAKQKYNIDVWGKILSVKK